MIGYYVHHQGAGHLQRFRSIAAHLDDQVTMLTSAATGPSVAPTIDLPPDNLTGGADPTANGTLHWVPLFDAGLRGRMARIARWIDEVDPDLMVVDVSVEVTLLCRLLGVPTVVVAMPGDRLDRPHRSAYDAATAILAPWAAEFANRDWPKPWLDKTFHAGAMSRFDDHTFPEIKPGDRPSRVLALWGRGGDGPPLIEIAAARAATPGWQWRVAGVGGSTDVRDLLGWADVVVSHAGQNSVAEIAAARRPAVVIADDRPHGEQAATASGLQKAGLATGLTSWPEPASWPTLLAQATMRGGAGWKRWVRGDGAQRSAEFLTRLAAARRQPDPAEGPE